MRWIHLLFFVPLIFLFSCSGKGSKGIDNEKLNPDQLLEYADNVYSQGDFESAFLAYGYIYEHYPTSREYIDAVLGLSRCYAEFEDYEKGFDLLHNLLKENIIPSKVPGIYNVIAEFYERSAGISAQLTGESAPDYLTAIEYYQKAIDYPSSDDHRAKSYAQYKVGTLYERMNDFDKALEAYQRTASVYPEQQWAALAQEKSAIVTAKKERLKAYEALQRQKKDTLTTEPETPQPQAKEVVQPEKPTKADTLQKAQPPDTTKAPPAPEPEPVPIDTSSIDEKPKLDLD